MEIFFFFQNTSKSPKEKKQIFFFQDCCIEIRENNSAFRHLLQPTGSMNWSHFDAFLEWKKIGLCQWEKPEFFYQIENLNVIYLTDEKSPKTIARNVISQVYVPRHLVLPHWRAQLIWTGLPNPPKGGGKNLCHIYGSFLKYTSVNFCQSQSHQTSQTD